MTYKELKQKLLTCEKTLKCLQNGTYKNLSPEDIKTTQNKLNVIKEGILKEMKSIKDAVEFEDEKEAAAFADKNPETPVKIVKEAFSVEETKAIAKKVGKAVAMALKTVGDGVNSMKAIRIEENSFDIKVIYKIVKARFSIDLIDFDGVKKTTYKTFDPQKIFKKIDKVSLSQVLTNKRIKPLNLTLFSDHNPKTTTYGLGFKDKKKALYTLKAIKNRNLRYQVNVVATMLGRAKKHPYKTKKMNDAIKVFSLWMKNYKKNRGS